MKKIKLPTANQVANLKPVSKLLSKIQISHYNQQLTRQSNCAMVYEMDRGKLPGRGETGPYSPNCVDLGDGVRSDNSLFPPIYHLTPPSQKRKQLSHHSKAVPPREDMSAIRSYCNGDYISDCTYDETLAQTPSLTILMMCHVNLHPRSANW